MPKYTPTYDDMYETKPCLICGEPVLDEGRSTCSSRCEQMKKAYDDDWQWSMLKDYETEKD